MVSTRRSDPAAGAPVTVEVTWGFDDYAAWNEIRRRLVMDRGHEALAIETPPEEAEP